MQTRSIHAFFMLTSHYFVKWNTRGDCGVHAHPAWTPHINVLLEGHQFDVFESKPVHMFSSETKHQQSGEGE